MEAQNAVETAESFKIKLDGEEQEGRYSTVRAVERAIDIFAPDDKDHIVEVISSTTGKVVKTIYT